MLPDLFSSRRDIFYRPTTLQGIVEKAFGTTEFAEASIKRLQEHLQDPNSLIFLAGSLVGFKCGNPKKPWFGIPPDIASLADLDLGIIDEVLFNTLPPNEIIRDPQLVCPNLVGRISYGMSRPNSKMKGVMNRPLLRGIKRISYGMSRPNSKMKGVMNRPLLRGIKHISEHITEYTGRRVDLTFLPDRIALSQINFSSGCIVLANKESLTFSAK
ncbi:hypothetical protein HY041_00340 [Candidatus Roizmanbacteria bacterium]|nr:hypothetical protein [Candidatus Roizmanbacteria bacterium]